MALSNDPEHLAMYIVNLVFTVVTSELTFSVQAVLCWHLSWLDMTTLAGVPGLPGLCLVHNAAY